MGRPEKERNGVYGQDNFLDVGKGFEDVQVYAPLFQARACSRKMARISSGSG